MPEGHALHRLARQHNRDLAGRVVRAASPQGRFSHGAARIDGRVMLRAEAHGKHLWWRFSELAEVVHVHLGLYGQVTSAPVPAPEPRGALRLRLLTDQVYVDLRGPNRCELLTPPELRTLLARLGPDPLRRNADPDRAWQRLRRSRAPIGGLLLDQSIVSGIGNAYRAEILFRHHIAPHRTGTAVQNHEWLPLWDDLRQLMRYGARTGRIVTTRPEHRTVRRSPPGRENAFYVYRRAGLPCRICGTPVRAEPMAGRLLSYCPTCQPS
jgi:endonuclease VIII